MKIETDEQIIEHDVRRMTDSGKGSLQSALCTARLLERTSVYFDCDERGKIGSFYSSVDTLMPFVIVDGLSFAAIREYEYPEISGYDLVNLSERAKNILKASIERYGFRREKMRISREVD